MKEKSKSYDDLWVPFTMSLRTHRDLKMVLAVKIQGFTYVISELH